MRATLLALLLLAGCTRMDTNLAQRVLLDAGHTDIKLGSRAVLMCARDSTYSIEFWAKGPTGRPVHGALCRAGFTGAVSIRYE